MQKKSRARFTRNVISAAESLTRAIYTKYINPSNSERMQKTLDLDDVEGEKPCINDVMIPISARIDEEERIVALEEARKWAGWSRNMTYDCMGEDTMLLPYLNDGVVLNPKQLKKLNKKLFNGKNSSSKRGSRGGKSKNKKKDIEYLGRETYDDYWANRESMYTHGEWSEDDEENYEEAYKSIKFYPDITNELSVIEFSSLKAFSDYCDEHGYNVGVTDYENLKNWGVVHCCLDPIDLEYGEYAIITDTSYGGLYWTVEDDLPEDVKHPSEVTDGVEARTLTD